MAARRSHPEYPVWKQARQRCNNPNHERYADYGGRGIKMLLDFDDLIAHLGHRPSPYHQLDRIDNNGNYEIGNVRWATPEQQANNRRQRRTGFTKGPYNGKTEYNPRYLRRLNG